MKDLSSKKSRREWRKMAKKIRRKRIRKALAISAEELVEEEKKRKLKDPTYLTWLAEQRALELIHEEAADEHQKETHQRWQDYDKKVMLKWEQKLLIAARLEATKEKEKLQIKQEFDAEQERRQRLRDENKRIAEEKHRQYEELVQNIDNYINGVGALPNELTTITDSNPGREACSFYIKTASCQYGIKCSRNHQRPAVGTLLLLPNFFTHIRLEHGAPTEYGSDLLLEYDDEELYSAFTAFFHDVVPEMETFGKVEQFRVCNNHKPHLRGNVYVQFTRQRDALKAYRKLQGRYYACRMVNVEFCPSISWRNAICGLAFANKCPKGHGCNYLHVFKNPANKFPLIDDRNVVNASLRQQRTPLIRRQVDSSWDDQGDEKSAAKNWRWSESPEPGISDISRSRIGSRSSCGKRPSENRSTTRQSLRSARSRSKSRNRSHRSQTRNKHKKRSRSPCRQTSRHKKKSRSRSKSKSSRRKQHR